MRVRRPSPRWSAFGPVVLGVLFAVAAPPSMHSGAESTFEPAELSPISGDPERPRRHFRFRARSEPGPASAAGLYSRIRAALREGYALSRRLPALEYQAWTRYNTEPFVSAAHGRHYVNVYANDQGAPYGRFEHAGRLPVGSIVAKDSFALVRSGEIILGPLLVMEKMPEGFNYVSGDWKYTYIQPDGSVFGETKGSNAQRVEFCTACHLARERFDHLFFVPETFRATPPRDLAQ